MKMCLRCAMTALVAVVTLAPPSSAQTPDLGVCAPVAARVADTWLRGLPWDSAGARAAAASCDASDPAARAVAQAMVTLMTDSGEPALRDLAPALRTGTPSAAARYVECLALHELGRHEAALASCDLALARRQGWLVPELPRGRALADLGRPADAVTALRRGLQAVPHAYADWNLLALMLRRAGRPAEALAAYEEAFRQVPVSLAAWRATIAINLAAWAADSLRNPDRAVAVLGQVMQTDSMNTRVLVRWATIEQNRGRRGEARLLADRVLRIEPTNAEALNRRASLRAAEGDRAGAEADYRVASADTSDAGVVALFRLAMLRRDAGLGTEAENFVVDALLRRSRASGWFAVVPTVIADSARQLDVYNRVLARTASSPARLGRLRMPDRLLPPARKLEDAALLASDSLMQGADLDFVLLRHAQLLAQTGRLPDAANAFYRVAVRAQMAGRDPEALRRRAEALGARALLRTELGDVPGGVNDLRVAESVQLDLFGVEGDSATRYEQRVPLLRLPGASVMRDAEVSAGRTATTVGLALLRRGELEGFTWLMRGRPDSTSLEQFAAIVRERGLPLQDLAARLPASPAASDGVRFRHQISLGTAVQVVDAPGGASERAKYFETRGSLEQDVPLETLAFAPRRAAVAVRWWQLHAGARYLQRAALRQRNAEIFALASQRKRTGDGRWVQLAGNVGDPEAERWLQQAYGLTRGANGGWCSPSTGSALTLRVGFRPIGVFSENGVEIYVTERGDKYAEKYTTVHLEPQTGRLRAEHISRPALVLEPSGAPGQGGAIVHPRLGTLRASGCKSS